MKDIATIVLTSSLIAGVVSSVISYIISIRLKKLDFKNEYYKEILKKRLRAYEFIENQIAVLKSVVLGEDKRPFHMIFAQGEEKFLEFQRNMHLAISYGLWIDDKSSKTLDDMNNLFFNLNNHIHQKSDSEIEKIGQEYYQKVADFRIQLENDLKRGLYDLHDVKKAFKIKKRRSKRFIHAE